MMLTKDVKQLPGGREDHKQTIKKNKHNADNCFLQVSPMALCVPSTLFLNSKFDLSLTYRASR